MSEIPEESIWYPDEENVIKAHDVVMKEFGGYIGFERGIGVFKDIIAEVKSARGIYRKAAILLRRMIERRIFKDGNHRTAYVITKMFLEMNNRKMRIQNLEKIIKFIKDVWYYEIDEIERWLKDGTLPQRSHKSSRENS